MKNTYKISIQENDFKIVVCKTIAILSRSKYILEVKPAFKFLLQRTNEAVNTHMALHHVAFGDVM